MSLSSVARRSSDLPILSRNLYALRGGLSCKCREAPLVDPGLYIAIAEAFQINHRGRDVAVPHPLLQGADVDAVLEVARGIGVAEFVKEPAATVCSFSAAIDLYSPVFQFVAHHAMFAV